MTSSDWTAQPSRLASSGVPHPRRGKGSKKHILWSLPADWMMRVWNAAGGDWAYRDASAVHMLTPVRPAEFVPGERDDRSVPGVGITLAGKILVIGVAPVKSHRGKFGTGETAIRVRSDSPNTAIQHLVQRCRNDVGRVIVVKLEARTACERRLDESTVGRWSRCSHDYRVCLPSSGHRRLQADARCRGIRCRRGWPFHRQNPVPLWAGRTRAPAHGTDRRHCEADAAGRKHRACNFPERSAGCRRSTRGWLTDVPTLQADQRPSRG